MFAIRRTFSFQRLVKDMVNYKQPFRKARFYDSLTNEIKAVGLEDYIRKNGLEFICWIGSLVVVTIWCNTLQFTHFVYRIDTLNFEFKHKLDPEKFSERSALATIMPKLPLDEETIERLSKIFITLDKIQVTEQLTEIFRKAGLNAEFPKYLSLIQFLQICGFHKITADDVMKIESACWDDLEKVSMIEEGIKNRKLDEIKKYEAEVANEAKINEINVMINHKKVLEKERNHYKQKLIENNCVRYKRLISDMEKDIFNIQTKITSAKT